MTALRDEPCGEDERQEEIGRDRVSRHEYLQHVAIGVVFPALPGVTEGFTVLALEPSRALILGWPSPDGKPLVTWAFVLEDRVGGSTRLIVRARGGQGYSFRGFPPWMSRPIVRVVHFVMQRKQLLGIARRVESSGAMIPKATPWSDAWRRSA